MHVLGAQQYGHDSCLALHSAVASNIMTTCAGVRAERSDTALDAHQRVCTVEHCIQDSCAASGQHALHSEMLQMEAACLFNCCAGMYGAEVVGFWLVSMLFSGVWSGEAGLAHICCLQVA